MPTPTIVLMVFLNVILCGAFSLFSFFLARPPRALNRRYPTLFHIMDKRETIAVVFCAPAKTQAMGVPLVQAMYASSSEATRASLQVPIVLYTVEGILIAQVLVAIFKKWLAVEAEKGVESVMTSSSGVSHLEENKGEQRPAESLDDKEVK
jgi:solute carrier family 10 (sodium/bile acid cotransporter), member 7